MLKDEIKFLKQNLHFKIKLADYLLDAGTLGKSHAYFISLPEILEVTVALI